MPWNLRYASLPVPHLEVPILPAFATLVRTNAKKVRTEEVPFYFITDPATKRQVFYVAGVPGKGSVFGSLTKINAHLKTKGKGEKEFPKEAKFCTGTVVRKDDTLSFSPEAKKGVSGSNLVKTLKRLTIEAKLGLGLIGLAGAEDDEEDLTPPPATGPEVDLNEPDEPEEVPETPKESTEKQEKSKEEEDETPKVEIPKAPDLPPPGPTSGPKAGDVARLRTAMRSRCGALQKGDTGTFAYFATCLDGKPLLILSKPGVNIESAMLKAGTNPVEGAYRCVVPGGVELAGTPFDTKPFVGELGLRCRFVAKLATDSPPPNLAEWKSARDKVVFDLKTVAAKVKSTGFPESGEVVQLLRTIALNLRVEPVTPADVRQLERYLSEDDDVAAADEIPSVVGTLSIRKPLLKALELLPH